MRAELFDEDPDGLPAQVLVVLHASPHRLTAEQIAREVEAKYGEESALANDQKLKYTLQAMVSLRKLTHEREKNPRGYGIPGKHT